MKTIRESTKNDTLALAALYRECREDADWLSLDAKMNADFEGDTDGEQIYVCVAEEGGIVGFVSVWMRESFIHHLYVHPSARGQGVGTALLNFMRGRVALPWSLKCAHANTQAAHFYCSRGWEIIDSVCHCDEPYSLFEFDARDPLIF